MVDSTVGGVTTGRLAAGGGVTPGRLAVGEGGSTNTVGNAEGPKVGGTEGALEGSSNKGACTVTPGIVAARLVDTALTVLGFANKASMEDVLPADTVVTTLYSTCTPTTVANNSLLRDDVTVPSDQNSFTEVIVTMLPAGNTDMIDAVKAV